MTTNPSPRPEALSPEALDALLNRIEEKAAELRHYREAYTAATGETELVYTQGQDRLEDDLDEQARRYLALLDDVSLALRAQAAALESRDPRI